LAQVKQIFDSQPRPHSTKKRRRHFTITNSPKKSQKPQTSPQSPQSPQSPNDEEKDYDNPTPNPKPESIIREEHFQKVSLWTELNHKQALKHTKLFGKFYKQSSITDLTALCSTHNIPVPITTSKQRFYQYFAYAFLQGGPHPPLPK
jgi:hypothetical protein